MSLPRRALAALAVLGALAALAACGSGGTEEKNAYVDRVNRAQAQFAASFETLSRRITSSSSAGQDARTLQEFEQAADRTARDLRAITPPSQVTDLHRELIKEIDAYGAALGRARTQLGGSASKAAAAERQLASETSRTSADVGQTTDAINRKLRE